MRFQALMIIFREPLLNRELYNHLMQIGDNDMNKMKIQVGTEQIK